MKIQIYTLVASHSNQGIYMINSSASYGWDHLLSKFLGQPWAADATV